MAAPFIAQTNKRDIQTMMYGYNRWAEQNDIDDCDGYSLSFIEGCKEYAAEN
jgi:hypothetical protein